MIQKERIPLINGAVGNRYSACMSVIDLAQNQRKIEIGVSGLCLAEVCKNPEIRDSADDVVAKYFEGDHILIIPVDRLVGVRARDLIRAQAALKVADDNVHVPKPQDAVHIASALISNADELNTFDKNLLGLTGKLIKEDGNALKICQPSESKPTRRPV